MKANLDGFIKNMLNMGLCHSDQSRFRYGDFSLQIRYQNQYAMIHDDIYFELPDGTIYRIYVENHGNVNYQFQIEIDDELIGCWLLKTHSRQGIDRSFIYIKPTSYQKYRHLIADAPLAPTITTSSNQLSTICIKLKSENQTELTQFKIYLR